MINNFYKECNLYLDEKDYSLLNELLQMSKEKNNYLDAYQNKIPEREDEVFFQSFVRDFEKDYSQTGLFKKIKKMFIDIDGFDYYEKAQIVKITGSLIPHVDARSCVLTIPLENTVDPISWYNEKNEVIYTYYYKFPVLINTHIKHGCIENTNDRYLFQVGIDNKFGSFQDICNLLQKSGYL